MGDLLESLAPQFVAHRDAQVRGGSQGGELCGERMGDSIRALRLYLESISDPSLAA